MDYLVFSIGLLLVAAAVGAGFLYRREKLLGHWPVLAFGLLMLALAGWVDLVYFASSGEGSPPLVRVACGVLATLGFGWFFSYFSWAKPGALRWVKGSLVILAIVSAIAFGLENEQSPGFFIPMGMMAFFAGWEIGDRWIRGRVGKSACGLILMIIAFVQMIPDAVEVGFNVRGNEVWSRIVFLTVLSVALGCALALSWVIWTRWMSESSEARRHRPPISPHLFVASFAVLIMYGGWMAHWLGNLAQDEQRSMLLSAIGLGATSLDADVISTIESRESEVNGDAFQSQAAKLVRIHKSLPKARFVYVIGKRGDHLVFLADAEPRLSPHFSPPGMIYDEHPDKWKNALNGFSNFDGPDADRWGVWFTAIIPLRSPQTARIVGALGVDYPAAEWLKPIAARRLAAMVVTTSVAFLILTLYGLHIVAAEKGRHVDLLSERLKDAMDAAELDTWEWFPLSARLAVGQKISAVLGISGGEDGVPLLQIWRRIHPEDRATLQRMFKRTDTGSLASSEAEIRLRVATKAYVWFMVRGRVVEKGDGESDRLTGTILNVDASYLARLEVEKQRRFAQEVMESVPTAVAVVTVEGAIRYANPAFSRLVRRLPDELEGVSIDRLLPGANGLGVDGNERQLVLDDGEEVPVQAFRANLQGDDGVSGSIVSLIDLTSIKKAEHELKVSRAEARRLALVAKLTDNSVLITDRQGAVEWVNDGFTRISGFTLDEVRGRMLGNVLSGNGSPEDLARRAAVRKRIAAGMGFEFQLTNRTKSGRLYYGDMEGQPLFDRQGELTGYMSIERDVTQERRSARLLEAVSSISSTLLSSAKLSDDLWPSVISELGAAADVERCLLMRCHSHPKTKEPSMSAISQWSADYRFRLPDENLQNIEFSKLGFDRWWPLLSSGSEIRGTIESFPEKERLQLEKAGIRSLVVMPVFVGSTLWGCIGLDSCIDAREWEPGEIGLLKSASANIGLRLVAEAESDALRAARDAAERANLAKSTFLATMSHEIRTPLNAVIGMASLLETTPLNEQQKDHAETILRSSHFLLELINDILDYSRIESGHIELEDTPFLVSEVCKGVFDVVRAGAIGKRIEVICRISPELPNCFTGDAGRVRQILINLLGNAMKFTSEGFVSLIVSGRKMPDGEWVVDFEVADSGIGIAPESLDRLFKPFTQEDSSTTRRFGGSGLGLAICKRLADLMGGDVVATSTKGVGSVFRLSLPLREAPGIAPAAEIPDSLPEGWNPKVLIVDDNDLNRRILEEILAGFGIHSHVAESGFLAIRAWQDHGPFDIVLSDYHMPMMDGADLVRHLRSLPDSGNTRFALLGSDSLYGSEIRELFDVVGTKPVWPASILAMLKSLSPQKIEADANRKTRIDEGLGKLRVLVAEDNANNQKVIRLLLRQLGIEPDLVADGMEALEAVSKSSYDVILMDVQMPRMDGLEATRRIRSDFSDRPIFIVALTANAFQEDRDAALAAGMNLYLPKPITLNGLKAALSEAVLELPAP